jgi:voltage-gated potassium channel
MLYMNRSRFAMFRHLPRYSKVFVNSLFSPAIFFFVLVGNLLLFSCIGIFYWVESDLNPNVTHLFDAIWWGVSTVTTVGYGDIVPVTTEGRIIGIVLMISGVSFFIGFSAVLFSTFMAYESEALLEEEVKAVQDIDEQILSRLDEISHRLERLESRENNTLE